MQNKNSKYIINLIMENSAYTINCVIWNFLSLFIVAISLILFISIFFLKIKKVKEDVLLCEKLGFQICMCLYFSFCSLLESFEVISTESSIRFNKYILQTYLTGAYLLSLLILFEDYRAIRDPTLVFRSLIKNTKNNPLYEIIVVSSVIIFILLEFNLTIIPNDIDSKTNYHILDEFFISFNLILMIFISILSVLSIVIYFLNNQNFNNYKVTSISNAELRNFLKFLTSVGYLLYPIFLMLFHIMSLKNKSLEILNTTSNYLMLVIILIDCVLSALMIYKTDFFYYTLGDSYIGLPFRIFGEDYYRRPLLNKESMSPGYKENPMLFYHTNLHYAIEEYVVSTLDHILNVSLASLNLVFSMKNANRLELRTRQLSERNMKQGLDPVAEISEHESCTVGMQSSLLEMQKEQEQEEEIKENLNANANAIGKSNHHQETKFTFTKSRLKNDFRDESLDKLTNIFSSKQNSSIIINKSIYSNLEVTVNSFFTEDFADIMSSRKIDAIDITSSLISHSVTDQLNPSVMWNSLLGKNARDEYFKTMKTLTIKTFDNCLILDIFEGVFDRKKKSGLFRVIKKYIKHIGKYQHSFLPVVIGAFEITVDKFQPFSVIVSNNAIIENIPKEIFNYWQLMRFRYPRIIEKIACSKDRASFLVTEDILFQKTTSTKLILPNYLRFQDIFDTDIKFLKKIHSQNFAMLIMYYEFGQLNNNNNQTPNKSIDNNISNYFAGDDFLRVSNTNTITPNLRISDIKAIVIPDRSPFDGESTILDLKNDITLAQFQEKNWFEAAFNNFRCLLFFSFENIFEEGGCCTPKDIYQKYKNELMNNFDQGSKL